MSEFGESQDNLREGSENDNSDVDDDDDDDNLYQDVSDLNIVDNSVSEELAPKAAVVKDMATSLEHKERGNGLFKEKNYDGAIDEYTIAIDLAPCDIDVLAEASDPYGLRAVPPGVGDSSKKRSGDSSVDESADAASETLQAASPAPASISAEVAQQREHLAACFGNRAASYMAIEEYELVVEDCSHALKVKPDYAKVLYRKCQALEKLDRIDEALADAKAVQSIDPSFLKISETVKRLERLNNERLEKMKSEAMGKLKELGNSILGNFGMSLDNFKMQQDPKTGGWSISMNNNSNS